VVLDGYKAVEAVEAAFHIQLVLVFRRLMAVLGGGRLIMLPIKYQQVI
jgi:hypothetical protein